jgi:hypothetical protein
VDTKHSCGGQLTTQQSSLELLPTWPLPTAKISRPLSIALASARRSHPRIVRKSLKSLLSLPNHSFLLSASEFPRFQSMQILSHPWNAVCEFKESPRRAGGFPFTKSRNWSISFIWSIWSVLLAGPRTGLSGLFGLSRSFGWLISETQETQMNQTNQRDQTDWTDQRDQRDERESR